MSYSVARALQEAVFAAVAGDATVQSLIGTNVFDALPGGTLPATYVLLGDETVVASGDSSGSGARHDIQISVLSDAAGFAIGKDVAAAISACLADADLTLTEGSLSSIYFLKARAKRGTGTDARRIDLWFRARVDDF